MISWNRLRLIEIDEIVSHFNSSTPDSLSKSILVALNWSNVANNSVKPSCVYVVIVLIDVFD